VHGTHGARNPGKVIKWYVDYVLDVTGAELSEGEDVVTLVMNELGELVEEARRGMAVIPKESVFDEKGRVVSFDARDVLRFLEGASPDQLETFKRLLLRELRRRRRLGEEVNKIESEVEKYIKSLRVYVPFSILEYDRFRLWGDRYHFFFKAEVGVHKYLDEYEGTLSELIEFFKRVVARESRDVSKLVERARRERGKWVKRVAGLSRLLHELESHVIEKAILTIGGPKLARPSAWRGLNDSVIIAMDMGLFKDDSGEIIRWDVTRAGPGDVVYGANPHMWPEFYEWFVESARTSRLLSVILRSFRAEVDGLSGLPVKELRGYVVIMDKDKIEYKQLSARELMEAHTTDFTTGKRFEPEPAVIYCGPGDDRIYSIRGRDT
jgi:predicted transcriptional regulator